jgi:hypothetical protein
VADRPRQVIVIMENEGSSLSPLLLLLFEELLPPLTSCVGRVELALKKEPSVLKDGKILNRSSLLRNAVISLGLLSLTLHADCDMLVFDRLALCN